MIGWSRRLWGCSQPLLVTLLVLLLAACAPSTPDDITTDDGELVVFAAASLRDALDEIAPRFEAQTGATVRFNFAGSNVLARQIAAAPGADVFVSADPLWAKSLEEDGRLADDSLRTVCSNRLVLIAHQEARFELERLADLSEAEFQFLALADPQAVPAGRYARSALESVSMSDHDSGSLWQAVEPRVAPAADVRAALALVASRPDTVGIVYASDLATGRGVREVLRIPAESTPPIRYVGAVVRGGREPLGQAFLDLLAEPESLAVFERLGFAVASSPQRP